MIVPKHIAVIMDGNGRWAKKNFLDRAKGHLNGAENLIKIAHIAAEKGVEYMTFFAFSTENWKRSEDEVVTLMNLMGKFIERQINVCEKENFRYDVIGDITKLHPSLQERLGVLLKLTENKTGATAIFAVNYGGRDEIIRATKKMYSEIENKNLNINNIDENTFKEYLDTSKYPDPDLVIRTSGEMRISNFLIWQSAYSEFYFTDVLWPDFSENDLDKAIFEYNKRERRFGGRK